MPKRYIRKGTAFKQRPATMLSPAALYKPTAQAMFYFSCRPRFILTVLFWQE